METHKRENRKRIVLGHIVRAHVSTALPVSSKTVVERMGGNVSSATIRNVMAELEDEGLIEQRHTSAGRIPTGYGYRYYVDMLTDDIKKEKRQAERLAREYTRKINSIKEVIEKTTFLISRELRNTGLVLWPGVENLYLKHLQLVRLRSETVLAVLITMTNAVRNYIIRLDREVRSQELQRISNFVNDNYTEQTLAAISAKLEKEIDAPGRSSAGENSNIARSAAEIVKGILSEDMDREIYWEGVDNFMNEPEFSDVNTARRILHMFSEKQTLMRILGKDIDSNEIKVYIGGESGCDMLNDCSLVTCGYFYRGRSLGRFGVLGLTRMDYGRALRTVSCLSELISAKLEEIDG